MKNRDRYINKVNEYDMLSAMHRNLQRLADNESFVPCILDTITGTLNPCNTDEYMEMDCETCIQAWLNEEG